MMAFTMEKTDIIPWQLLSLKILIGAILTRLNGKVNKEFQKNVYAEHPIFTTK